MKLESGRPHDLLKMQNFYHNRPIWRFSLPRQNLTLTKAVALEPGA